MRSLLLPTLCLVATFSLVPSGLAEDSCAGSGCCGEEPFLKFLDDVFGPPCARRRREPFAERIETERHDFTQSPRTVGCGVFQVEAGYSYFYNDQDEEIEQSHTTPEFLLRFGLSDDIELRLRTNYAWRFIDAAENRVGAEDMRLGLKLGMTDQDGTIPETAVELIMSVPTGSEAWTTGRVESGFDCIYGWELDEQFQFYGSTGFFLNAVGDFGFLPDEPAAGHFSVWTQSAALGAELTERVTSYFEYYQVVSHNAAPNFTVGIFNIGVDFYVSHDAVLDVRIGWGLTDDADDLFAGVGGGFRF